MRVIGYISVFVIRTEMLARKLSALYTATAYVKGPCRDENYLTGIGYIL